MKTRLLLSLTLIFALTGCELIKDKATVPISTQLKADVPLVIVTPGTKSVNAIVFNKSQTLSLSDNTDIKPYLDKVKEIDLNSLVVTVTGLTAGQTINSVALDVTGVGNVFTQTNITSTNNSFTPTLATGVLGQVSTKLLNDKMITLTLSGNVSGPMNITVSLNFGVEVVAYVL
ncbi:MAG: hypothetical protein IPH69_17470 [Bacteroidales bacterium]|nr:hypothetical protein [Bacteroidales bacterium]MBK7626656.1 hypothetical protein [Bacteroidales bacterium]